MTENTNRIQRGRPFSLGISGNPRGRPKGSLNKATLAAQVILTGEAESLTRKAVELALEGDTTALRLCLDRLVPPVRERRLDLSLSVPATAKGIAQVMSEITGAVTRGEITPGEGSTLATIVEQHRKALESSAFEDRIRALEEDQQRKRTSL